MELLEVDCGNGVERGLGPLNIPQPISQSLGTATSLSHALSPFFCGSGVGCSNERWLVADCDLCGGGFGCAGRGPLEGRRWIRGVTEGDNLITAFYLLSSSSSTLAGFTRSFRPRHVTMVTWNLVRSQVPEMTWWSWQRWTNAESCPRLKENSTQRKETKDRWIHRKG